MKKYNRLIAVCIVLYMVLAVSTGMLLKNSQNEREQFYKVEINRLMAGIKSPEDIGRIDPGSCREIKSITFLPASETDRDIILDFYSGTNGKMSVVYPLYGMDAVSAQDKGQPEGWLRFDIEKKESGIPSLVLAEAVLFLMEIFLLAVLFYIRNHLVMPFSRMQDMAQELSKGNLYGEIKAEKNQYFGKFLWGISSLRDALLTSRRRELDLQKEKKLLLLSLSHDIKTPLNMIKLYVKALADGIYITEDEQKKVYGQIEEKTVQIENFVSEIMKASREDIIHIEVEKGEFYLKNLIQLIEAVYGEKCALRKCNLSIGEYKDKLLAGDMNRLFEVFENLFANAFKYGDGRRIEISFYEEDYCQCIQVFNTGETVAQNEFVHMFDSFYRGENTRGQQGSGLGLYICKEIMHKMGGEIFAEILKDGMAFTVVLPM